MPKHFEQPTPPKRLRTAMERGFLNARCRNRVELLRAYGLWCWRMGLPMVWFEPRSPHSRLSRVHLDLFTTSGTLSLRGHVALIAVSAGSVPARHGSISPHAAVWDRVSPKVAAELARTVFRTVRRAGNFELAARPVEPPVDSKVIPFPRARLA
jgi:hypothetical protein